MDQPEDLSRREFFKGVGSAGAAALVFSAIGATLAGEVIQSSTAGDIHNRPWWIRQVDEPTLGVDWDNMQRFSALRGHLRGESGLSFLAEADELTALLRNADQLERERIERGVPGYRLQDQAMYAAFQTARNHLPFSFTGLEAAPTPEERGVAHWQGSPEEATRIVKAALRHMGAATVGVVELDERTRKLIYSEDEDGKEIVFEDTPRGYEDATRRVIPNSHRWVIVYTVQMSEETLKRAPTAIGAQTTMLAYFRGVSIQIIAQEFLRGLGYQGLGQPTVNSLGIAPAFAVMAGLGEMSRLNRVITPEYGPMVRIFFLITDLPLTPDRPIDAGIARFCRTCMKCAEACPPSALSFAREPGWEVEGAWNNPGHEAWFENSARCRRYWIESAGTNCGICFAVCPWSKKDRSFIHDFTKMHIATLPALNGPVRSFDDAFGYGIQKDPEAWWLADLPPYGIEP